MEHKRQRGYAIIALDNPKNTINIGSAMRAVGCYEAAMLVVGGKRNGYRPVSKNWKATDTQKSYRHYPLIQTEDVFSALPYDCVPVAVDLVDDAQSLTEYKHPERAFYIFGAEDATLGDRVLSRVRDVVYVPTSYCMNLAATVNVVLYDRMAKSGKGL